MGELHKSRPLILDVSGSYNPIVDWDALKGRIYGAICKLGEVDDTAVFDGWLDSKFTANVAGLAKNDLMCGGYIFVNSAYYPNRQITETETNNWDNIDDDLKWAETVLKPGFDDQLRVIVKQLTIGEEWMTDVSKLRTSMKRRVNVLCLDDERWWRSYNELYANKTTARVVEPFWILKTSKLLHERLTRLMNREFLPQIPIVHYSGLWFIDQYSPTFLKNQMDLWETWPATWYWGSGTINTTVEQLKDVYLSQIPDDFKFRDFGKIIRIRQLSGDRFIIPEVKNKYNIPTRVDINSFNGTIDQANLFFKLGTIPPPPPPLPPPVTGLEELKTRVTALETDVAKLKTWAGSY